MKQQKIELLEASVVAGIADVLAAPTVDPTEEVLVNLPPAAPLPSREPLFEEGDVVYIKAVTTEGTRGYVMNVFY